MINEPVDHQRRFGGLTRLYGTQGAAQVFAAHVVVIGIGGVGSWSAEALARSGVGRITLIDTDHIAESNINRQIHSLSSTLGKAKIEAMQERIHSVNPQCHVHVIDDFVTPENWSLLCANIASLAPIQGIIDACDQVAAKTALSAWALKHKKITFITVGAAGGKQQAELVQIKDLSQTTHDPLLAKMRYNLRRHHGAPRAGNVGVTCVYSQEPVQQPQALQDAAASDGTLNCHGFGSSVSVTATFGLCAAGWAIRELAKVSKKAL